MSDVEQLTLFDVRTTYSVVATAEQDGEEIPFMTFTPPSNATSREHALRWGQDLAKFLDSSDVQWSTSDAEYYQTGVRAGISKGRYIMLRVQSTDTYYTSSGERL